MHSIGLDDAKDCVIDERRLYVSSNPVQGWNFCQILVFDLRDGCFITPIGDDMHLSDVHSVFGFAIADGLLYVVDSVENRVSVFELEKNTFLLHIGTGQGKGDGELNGPAGVTVDANCVYIAERNNDRVSVFSRSDGKFLRHVGGLRTPSGVAECDGLLYVSEPATNSLAVLRADDGTFIQYLGENAEEGGQFKTPRMLHINEHRLYVAEKECRISVFQL